MLKYGVTVMVAVILALVLFTGLNAGMVPVLDALIPIPEFEFVQLYVSPVAGELVNAMAG